VSTAPGDRRTGGEEERRTRGHKDRRTGGEEERRTQGQEDTRTGGEEDVNNLKVVVCVPTALDVRYNNITDAGVAHLADLLQVSMRGMVFIILV